MNLKMSFVQVQESETSQHTCLATGRSCAMNSSVTCIWQKIFPGTTILFYLLVGCCFPFVDLKSLIILLH